MKKAIAFIPARYASTRFPGKPLVEIRGKSMIMRVYEQAIKAKLLKDVYVATDDDRIYDHVIKNAGKALMTSMDHTNGTERCLEAFHLLLKNKKCSEDEIILNIQGDEPFIHPMQIDSLLKLFARTEVNIATLIKGIRSADELNNPNCVKVVTGNLGQALYFSRAPIPFLSKNAGISEFSAGSYNKHIGLYAYRSKTLEAISKLKPSPLESAEKLEQLRWLENGYTIHVESTEHDSIAIDSPADLSKVTNIA